jgi:hypothetical protein
MRPAEIICPRLSGLLPDCPVYSKNFDPAELEKSQRPEFSSAQLYSINIYTICSMPSKFGPLIHAPGYD